VIGAPAEPHVDTAAVASGKVEYDYIVIGSGAGGGPVAANLARAGYEVLVLEAGGLEVDDSVYRVPAFHLLASADPRMNWNFFVKHYSDVDKHGETYIREHGGVLYPRASAVGGCTAHHVMLTLYPENRDWDDIAAITGDPTWGSFNMRQYFEQVKTWLPITHTPPALLLRDQVISRLVTAAALETHSLGRSLGGDLNLNRFAIAGLNLDPNDFSHVDALRESLYMIPQSTENGERRGTRERLLNTMVATPDRLFLQTHALVQRILFDRAGDKLRATGVEFPELYVFGTPARFEGYAPGFAAKGLAERNYFTWAILKGYSQNDTGTVRLRSADPTSAPEINFRYFNDGQAGEYDLDAVREGLELARAINARPRTLGWLDQNKDHEVFPGEHVRSVEQIQDFIKKDSWGHHASCSNRMGPASDPLAVVDSQFKVHGTSNLRVVDASVFPRIPGLFIVLSVYMIAEKASEDILRDARRMEHLS